MNMGIAIKGKNNFFSNEKVWCGILIGLGIFFRIFHFFYNRSLWMDEVYLSTSLIKLNYAELAQQSLDYQQKAPLGFLWTVKSFVYLLGTNEKALRLLSLLSGICAMFLFVPVARYFLKPLGVVTAIGILALAPPLIFHSVEIKQYETELFASLLALYLYIRYHETQSTGSLVQWGIAGAIILWFSYSSVFILGGIAFALSLVAIYRKNWSLFFRQLIPFLLWLISFAINFLLFTHKHAESEWIVYWFDFYRTFMPVPPSSAGDIQWYLSNFYHLIEYPLGLNWTLFASDNFFIKFLLKGNWLALFLLVYGVWLFARERKYFLLLFFPFLLTFIASGLKLYPLVERFWVFISPLLILFIAKGTEALTIGFAKWRLRLLIPVVLLCGPLYTSAHFIVHPDELIIHKRSFQREALAYINYHFKPGDILYVYWDDLPGFRFYQKTYPFKFEAIEGGDYRNQSLNFNDYLHHLQKDFNLFKGKKRVWFISNNYYRTTIGDRIDTPSWYYEKDNNSTDRLKKHFSTMGKQTIVFKSFDLNISLVELK